MSAQGVRAGRAYVEIGTNNSSLDAGLAAASQKLKSFGKSMTIAGGVMAAGGAAVLTPMIAAAFGAAETGDQLNKMANRTGASVEALSELRHAAEQSDVSFDQLGNGLKLMQKNLVNNGDAFTDLGLDVDKLMKLSPDKQFEAIADAIGAIDDPAKRTAAAMSVFGKSGADLLPLMIDGAKGIELLRKEARDLGLQVSTQDANAATLFGDTWANFQKVVKDVSTELGMALLPALTSILNGVIPLVKTVASWISENRALVVTVAAIAAGAVGLGTTIAGMGVAVTVAGSALGGLMTVFAAITSPIGLMVIAIGAATAAWLAFTDSGKATVAWVSTQLATIAGIVQQTMTGVMDAIQSGNFSLAAKIAFTGVKLAIVEIMNETAKLFGTSLTGMLNGLKGFVNAASSILQQLNKQTLDSNMIDVALKGVGIGTNIGLSQISSSIDPNNVRSELNALTNQAAAEKQAKQNAQKSEEKPIAKPIPGKNPLTGSGSLLSGFAKGISDMIQSGVAAGGSAIESAMEFLSKGVDQADKRSEGGGAAFGTFSAAEAAQNFGAGNVQQRMLTVQEKIEKNTREKSQPTATS